MISITITQDWPFAMNTYIDIETDDIGDAILYSFSRAKHVRINCMRGQDKTTSSSAECGAIVPAIEHGVDAETVPTTWET